MKLKHVYIENFKGLSKLDLDLVGNDGQARRLTALRGGNGSGKTSVLQAIALTLSLATRRTKEPQDLDWHGFLAERLGTRGETRVEVRVEFTDDELEAIQAVYQVWADTRTPDYSTIRPGRHREVTLVYERGRPYALEGADALFQFRGRSYIKTMLQRMPSLRAHFSRVGDVFWFDQHRNLGSRIENDGDGARARATWTAGVEQLRERLIGWWAYHTSAYREPSRDYIAGIQEAYGKLFPGTSFRGVQPRSPIADDPASDFLFLFERNGLTYDLMELSSGEQAVFPILSECVRLGMHRSVVLIDELELHLHPPQQQALLNALRHLAPESQFIITTHSPYLEDVIPDDWTCRLEGGRVWS
ncbi:MAG: AAA family ATPase [bacterium]|nr:AAA family ATPase [Myxococcales bacterium]